MGFLSLRSSRRTAYALAEAVIALGVAATGLGGVLSAVSVGMAVARESSMRARAVHLGRTIMASPAKLVDYEGRELFADAGGLNIREAPFNDSTFTISVKRPDQDAGARLIPFCLTIHWSNGSGTLKIMTAARASRFGDAR